MKTFSLLFAVLGFAIPNLPALAAAEPEASPTAVVQPAKAASETPVSISTISSEIVKLTRAGVNVNVVKTYVQNSSHAVSPSADEIVYLREQGISETVITALIERGGALRTQAQQFARAQLQAQPQPQPVQIQQAPTQVYTYPVQQPQQVERVYYVDSPSYSYYRYPSFGFNYVGPYAWGFNYYSRPSFGAGHRGWGGGQGFHGRGPLGGHTTVHAGFHR